MPVYPTYDLSAQFRLLQILDDVGSVPVPKVWWFEPDPATVGASFFVMDRLDGRVPPDVMPYNFGSWLSEVSADQQRYGLAGSVWSTDSERAIDVARRIRTGIVSINGFTLDFNCPFGGFKSSGLGRERPRALTAYLEPKTINTAAGGAIPLGS